MCPLPTDPGSPQAPTPLSGHLTPKCAPPERWWAQVPAKG